MTEKELIEVIEIVERLNDGEKIGVLAKEKAMSKSSIYKKLNSVGFTYDKKQQLWYEECNNELKEMIRFMSSIDVEAEVEGLSEKRYYYRNGFYYDEKELTEISIDQNIYDELQIVADEWGADNVEEVTQLIILRFLENIRPRDFREEFRFRRLEEEGYDSREIEIILKYDEESDELWDFYKNVLLNEIGYTETQINSIEDGDFPSHYNLSKKCKDFEKNQKHISNY